MARNCIGGTIFIELADTRAEHNCASQTYNAADHVNRAGTCKVHCAVTETGNTPQILKPAAAPDPPCNDRVDEHANPQAHSNEAGELKAFCHGTGWDGGSSVHEDHLEQEEGENASIRSQTGKKESTATEDAKLTKA